MLEFLRKGSGDAETRLYIGVLQYMGMIIRIYSGLLHTPVNKVAVMPLRVVCQLPIKTDCFINPFWRFCQGR